MEIKVSPGTPCPCGRCHVARQHRIAARTICNEAALQHAVGTPVSDAAIALARWHLYLADSVRPVSEAALS
jgi:hypothetical protein